MSEASRARIQRALNIAEEIAWREGGAGLHRPSGHCSCCIPPPPPPPGIVCDPSWGPIDGPYARQLLGDAEFERLAAHDAQIAALERQRRRIDAEASGRPGRPPVNEDARQASEPQKRVLQAREALQRLDEHGETQLYACPSCGEESAKASVPLDLWHCTSCDSSGRVPRPNQGSVLPDTTVHRV